MEPLLGEVLEHDLVLDFECNDLLGLNLELSKHLKLLQVEWAAIEDPAVQAAVRFVEPLIDQVDHILVGNYKMYTIRHTID